ncbi:DNA helicase HerA, contains HAS-barrel and ATPase domains [Allopseudospirillum japonicum]|uniref:DNA helicase HerA, contains HAS-barrel and ATPase domains n=1 Tax=Allopseudospirillum japonicum TaxID=64971 RepID=A0A1H6SMG5_9GAMM|nr:ATP-binding protein [Allopseudospirillum japonicum]SEI64732.1 DNA helicase HerA, contains HAS-barrel and ATPase domains [Allopseudospirillum japonicum]
MHPLKQDMPHALVDRQAKIQDLAQMPHFSWQQPLLTPEHFYPPLTGERLDYRFFQVTEVSRDHAEGYRLAMANVLSIAHDSQAALAYLLKGDPQGVRLYLGVIEQGGKAHEASRQLKSAVEGNFLGVRLQEVKQDDVAFQRILDTNRHLGLVQGVPSFNEQAQHQEVQEFQGIERLANALQGESWQLLLVAQPSQETEINQMIEQIYQFSTQISTYVKQNVQHSESQGSQQSETTGKSQGTNKGWTHTVSENKTQGQSKGKSISQNEGGSQSTGESRSHSRSKSEGVSDSRSSGSSSKSTNTSTSESSTTGTSHTQGTSWGTSESANTGESSSQSEGVNFGRSEGESIGTSQSNTLGTNENRSLALTRERTNKSLEEMQKHVSETLLERFRLGLSKGMFKTSLYLGAADQRTFKILKQSVRSIFQGNQAGVTPLKIYPLTPTRQLTDLLQGRVQNLLQLDEQACLIHSLPFDPVEQQIQAATWLNTRELALLAGLPSREIPGIRVRHSVDFAINVPKISDKALPLGHLVHHGRHLHTHPLDLALADLNKHVFVTGVTGSGKTTTCMRLLESSGLPFLVIEPAKTEYRALYARGQAVEYYLVGREDISPFRFNPFELVNARHQLSGHISLLTATLTTVYPMEAAMPQLVEEAIIGAYQAYGWDTHSGRNLFYQDPWAPEVQGACWPIFSDMIAQLDALIASKGMGKEFEEKYRGSLVARLSNLTDGIKGAMLNTRRSLDFQQLLDRQVVIELEEIKSEQDKALLMGLIITRLAECVKERHRLQPDFQHLTLIEEAHRLLTRPEPGESDARKLGVEMFANLLAEVRKYGEGLIIADQIPNKLIADVVKNTHTKIVHRLFAADDRRSIGDAMGLNEAQRDFLPLLQTGETLVYCGGWHGAVRAQIEPLTQTDAPSLLEEDLQRQGQKQLWQHRHWLYPHLSQCEPMQHPKALACLVYEGNLLIQLWIRLLKSSHLPSYKRAQEDDKLQAALRRWSDQILAHLPELAGPESLMTCVLALMQDTLIKPENQHKTEELACLHTYLLEGYHQALKVTEIDFQEARAPLLRLLSLQH